MYQLSNEIQQKFDGKKWALPAIVYARALELYPGRKITPSMLEEELVLSGYRQEENVSGSGGFLREGDFFTVFTRDFVYPSGKEAGQKLHITFADDTLRSIVSTTGEQKPYLRIDPARIGSFHPLVNEERLVVDQDDIPFVLKQTLIAIEDKRFQEHRGISLRGIFRAFTANISAGKMVQGGSTLTQQLVKNFFLNSERTLSRKVKEAIMALLLEIHYTKDEILTTYINEIFLGQDGNRAIHGFGLASRFYFRRELADLSVGQIATLVGIIKGPTLYDPRRNQENCSQRRKVVLDEMLAEKIIDQPVYEKALSEPILDVSPLQGAMNRFPAFMERVRREVVKEYKEEDLRSSGLNILTTLDPLVQITAEKEVADSVARLQSLSGNNSVEAAMVITSRETGEIEALIGSKSNSSHGFNRALDARRPIGSLVKPAVYLTGLAQGYTLASPLQDKSIVLANDGKPYRPKNYDRKEHGQVALYSALAHSYNLATVQLGVQLGVDRVRETLRLLGYQRDVSQYPSLFLGAVEMSPVEVAQCYQTVGSGGFFIPLRSIQAVLSHEGQLLTRYGLEVEQRFSADAMYLLMYNLQLVMEEGSGRRLRGFEKIAPAGKTGTTDGKRDSWFAGFTGDRLAVVWLGNDDNLPITLSGSAGALQVWGEVLSALQPEKLQLPEPPGIVWRRIDRKTLEPATLFNRNSVVLPFRGER